MTKPLDEALVFYGRQAFMEDHRVGSLLCGQAHGIVAPGDQRHHLAPSLLEEEAHQLTVEWLVGGDEDPEGPRGPSASRTPVQACYGRFTHTSPGNRGAQPAETPNPSPRHLRPSAGGVEVAFPCLIRQAGRVLRGDRGGVA